MQCLKNIQEIRARARQQIEQGSITKDYRLDREQAISILNEALATELVCVLRYKFHSSNTKSYQTQLGLRDCNTVVSHIGRESEHDLALPPDRKSPSP